MILLADALAIVTASFPHGPEALAHHLQIPVVKSPLTGCEGWCASKTNTVIRINENSTQSRQRFTLSHELAHLVLGTTSDVLSKPFRSNKAEEKAADALASEFLIPWDKLMDLGGNHLPVVSATIQHISKAANVSPIVSACRVVSACQELGLINAAVVFVKDGIEKWRYSKGLKFSASAAVDLVRDISQSKEKTLRIKLDNGNTIVGSVVDCWNFHLLLAQLLPSEVASQEAAAEKLERVRKQLFGDDKSAEGKVAGCIGAIRNKAGINSVEQAVAAFNETYLQKSFDDVWQAKLGSADGQDFLRGRFSKWLS